MQRRFAIFAALAVLVLDAGRVYAAALPIQPVSQAAIDAIRAEATANDHPYAVAFINNNMVNLTSLITTQAGSDISHLSADLTPYGANVKISASIDPDPLLTFGGSTTNAVAGPVTYAFLFGTPVVSDQYTVATTTGGFSLTNGVGGTATITSPGVYPTYFSGYGTLGAAPTNLGTDLGTETITASGDPGTVNTSKSFGTVSATFAPTTYDNLEALVTYNQTDLSSVVSFSGAVTLNVPEPFSMGIFGIGALVLGASRGFGRRGK